MKLSMTASGDAAVLVGVQVDVSAPCLSGTITARAPSTPPRSMPRRRAPSAIPVCRPRAFSAITRQRAMSPSRWYPNAIRPLCSFDEDSLGDQALHVGTCSTRGPGSSPSVMRWTSAGPRDRGRARELADAGADEVAPLS